MAKKDIKFNRGDVAEGILGAALAAKFINRPKKFGQNYPKLTKKDIDDLLDDFFRPPGNISVTTVKDVLVTKTQKKIRDNITLEISLPAAATAVLKKKSNRSVVSDLYESAIDYVEDTWIKDVETFAYNASPDKILIASDGVGDQKGTKADIKITINGKPYKKQISLKVSGGEQFFQVSGHDFSKQMKIWNDLLGLDINEFEKQYMKAISNYDSTAQFSSRDEKKLIAMKDMVKSAAEVVYREAAKQMARKISSKDTKFFKNLANMVFTGATRGDKSIELVKLDKEYKRMRFDRGFVKRYTEVLKKSDLKVSYREDGDPLIQVHTGTGVGKQNLILQIRVKVEAAPKGTNQGKRYSPYMRNIVEAGPMMFALGMK